MDFLNKDLTRFGKEILYDTHSTPSGIKLEDVDLKSSSINLQDNYYLNAVPIQNTVPFHVVYSLVRANSQYLSSTGRNWENPENGFRMISDGTLLGVTIKCQSGEDRRIYLGVNNDPFLASFNLSSGFFSNNGINIPLNQFDLIKLFVEKKDSPLTNIVVILQIKYS